MNKRHMRFTFFFISFFIKNNAMYVPENILFTDSKGNLRSIPRNDLIEIIESTSNIIKKCKNEIDFIQLSPIKIKTIFENDSTYNNGLKDACDYIAEAYAAIKKNILNINLIITTSPSKQELTNIFTEYIDILSFENIAQSEKFRQYQLVSHKINLSETKCRKPMRSILTIKQRNVIINGNNIKYDIVNIENNILLLKNMLDQALYLNTAALKERKFISIHLNVFNELKNNYHVIGEKLKTTSINIKEILYYNKIQKIINSTDDILIEKKAIESMIKQNDEFTVIQKIFYSEKKNNKPLIYITNNKDLLKLAKENLRETESLNEYFHKIKKVLGDKNILLFNNLLKKENHINNMINSQQSILRCNKKGTLALQGHATAIKTLLNSIYTHSSTQQQEKILLAP